MEKATKEQWPYEQAFTEANEDRDIEGGFVVPPAIAQKLTAWVMRELREVSNFLHVQNKRSAQ